MHSSGAHCFLLDHLSGWGLSSDVFFIKAAQNRLLVSSAIITGHLIFLNSNRSSFYFQVFVSAVLR